jgi:hypothetical protein
MGNEVWFDDTWWAVRDGDKLFIGRSKSHHTNRFDPTIALVLTEDGGVALEPEWEKRRTAELEHDRSWRTILRQLTLPVTLEVKLNEPPPLCLYSGKASMLAYLHTVAKNETGPLALTQLEREFLDKALHWAFPEGIP